MEDWALQSWASALEQGEELCWRELTVVPSSLSWGVRSRRVEEVRKHFIFVTGHSGVLPAAAGIT